MTHGGFGYAKEYHVERYLRESLIPRIAPISPQLILSFIAEKVLGLPKVVLEMVEARTFQASFRDAPLGAGPESILTIVVMDSGLVASLRPGMTEGEMLSS